MIYLDYSATTPVAPEVLDTLNKVSKEYIGNANSLNALGIKSKNLLESATKQIADLFNIKEKEITYVASSTECNNMAFIGYALANQKKGNHIIVSKLEHPSVFAICKYLETIGFTYSVVNNKEDGLIDLDHLKSLITDRTILVSICAVNSELGIRQSLKLIRQTINKVNPNVAFHSDMTQAVGKMPINLKDVDMASISSHKIFGPKGISLFYKSENIKVNNLLYGSGKSNDLKPGTPALPLIVGFSKALRLALTDMDKKEKFVKSLNEKICKYLSKYPDVLINKTEYSISQILNVSLLNIKPETFIHALDSHEVYVSTNTACSTGDISDAIMAVYNDENRARHSIRISLSYVTTLSEINKFLEIFDEEYHKLNNLGGSNGKDSNN